MKKIFNLNVKPESHSCIDWYESESSKHMISVKETFLNLGLLWVLLMWPKFNIVY